MSTSIPNLPQDMLQTQARVDEAMSKFRHELLESVREAVEIATGSEQAGGV